MRILKLNKKQFPKSDNKCDTCKNPLIIQLEYNVRDYDVSYKEGCLHCGYMNSSTLDIDKQCIGAHINSLILKNICITCNKDITAIYVEVCEKALVIFIRTTCPICKTRYIIVKQCESKEELESFNFNRNKEVKYID